MSPASEGVVQFGYRLTPAPPPRDPVVGELTRWRAELFRRDTIGCDLSRYGACYGNLSARTGPYAMAPGRREFLVSCTQTGGDPVGGAATLVRVVGYDHGRNHVTSVGSCPPSSETMTHGAMYDASLDVRAVVHGHDPRLWRWLLSTDAPRTPEAVAYGTPAMARAAFDCVRQDHERPWRQPGVLAMAGHEDGVVAWGGTVAEAARRFLSAWHVART